MTGGDRNAPRELELVAADGYRLAATLHEATSPVAVVVVQGATAVRRRFYARFAAALAEAGLTTLTVDYRGVGGSLHGSVATLDAEMTDWARHDAPAARREAARLAGDLPLLLFAHSFGGQAVAIEPPAEPVTAAVFVGCQEGDLRLWPWRLWPWSFWAVGVVIPVLARLLGYVPGWAGFGADLPGGVARQWARWCRTRGYAFGAEPGLAGRGDAVRFPILALSFADDRYAPPRAVSALLRRFPNADLEHRHRRPSELGRRRVGHFGYFRSEAAALWREPIDWLLRRAGTGTG